MAALGLILCVRGRRSPARRPDRRRRAAAASARRACGRTSWRWAAGDPGRAMSCSLPYAGYVAVDRAADRRRRPLRRRALRPQPAARRHRRGTRALAAVRPGARHRAPRRLVVAGTLSDGRAGPRDSRAVRQLGHPRRRSSACCGAFSAARCPAFRRRSRWRCCCRSPYGMDPVTAIVLLASVYVGAEYGGSIPAILIRTPGTNSASATVIDGYEMARQGRAGEALGISLIAGLVGRPVRPRRPGGWRPSRWRRWRWRSRRRPISRSACSASPSSRVCPAARCSRDCSRPPSA